jgi:hypothetical protein
MAKTTSKGSTTAHAYTPGLKVKRDITIQKIRRLPIPGELLVKVGDEVTEGQSVARAYLPGDSELLKVSSLLGIEPEDLPVVLRKKIGDSVKEGETIANYSAFFGLIKKSVESPVSGTIESISDITGRVLIRGPPKPLEIDAYIPGLIVDIIPREAVVIETNAGILQGIFGIGGETHGEIKIAVDSYQDELRDEHVSSEDAGKILVGGSEVTCKTLQKAAKVGIKGIIVGGIKDVELFAFTGTEIGVAITGNEDLGITFMVTEGFGKMNMSKRSFNLLKEFEGQQAAMNGATQIRAGVMRPEIIIPHGTLSKQSGDVDLSDGLTGGTPVRIIREPYFGALGAITSLPVELQRLESESYVRVAEVILETGEKVIIPRANVEIIEE